MTDLVKFLTARLDDIEYAGWHAYNCQILKPLPAGLHPAVFGTHMSCNCQGPDWMIADVRAKRRIIAMVDWLNNYAHPGVHTLNDLPARLVLRELAMPFANHVNYRSEWSTT